MSFVVELLHCMLSDRQLFEFIHAPTYSAPNYGAVYMSHARNNL